MNYQKIFLVLAVFCQAGMTQINAQNVILPTEKDSVSFYLGYVFGKQLAESEADVNVYVMSNGLRNALAKTPINLTDREVDNLLRKYFGELQAKANEKYLEDGRKFLETNGKNPGVVTLPNGLQYKIIREGTGAKPKETDNVEVMYHGTLVDGTVFDSAKERGEPVTFPVNGVIKGFAEALMLMNEGSLWKVYIPAELAYGDSATGGIKPNSVLIFEIDLLKVTEGNAENENIVEFEE